MEDIKLESYKNYTEAILTKILSINSKMNYIAQKIDNADLLKHTRDIKNTIHNFLLSDEIHLHANNIALSDVIERAMGIVSDFYPFCNVQFSGRNEALYLDTDVDLFYRCIVNLLIALAKSQKTAKIYINLRRIDTEKAQMKLSTAATDETVHIFEYKLVLQTLKLLGIELKNESNEKELKYTLNLDVSKKRNLLEIGEQTAITRLEL